MEQIKKIKIGVLGAGISGLSFAKLAQETYDVEILENNTNIRRPFEQSEQ